MAKTTSDFAVDPFGRRSKRCTDRANRLNLAAVRRRQTSLKPYHVQNMRAAKHELRLSHTREMFAMGNVRGAVYCTLTSTLPPQRTRTFQKRDLDYVTQARISITFRKPGLNQATAMRRSRYNDAGLTWNADPSR